MTCPKLKCESAAILKLDAPRPRVSQATNIFLHEHVYELVKERNPIPLLGNLKFFIPASKGSTLHFFISYFHINVFFEEISFFHKPPNVPQEKIFFFLNFYTQIGVFS